MSWWSCTRLTAGELAVPPPAPPPCLKADLTSFLYDLRGCLTYILRGRFARSVAPFLPALAATKNGSPKPKPSWLLASSGGSASAAMIDMFHQSMCTEDDGPKGRHRWSRLVVGWVDFGEEEEDRKAARVEAMKRSAVLHGFEFWRVSVDEAFDEEGALLDPLEDKGTRGDIGSIGIKVHPGRGEPAEQPEQLLRS